MNSATSPLEIARSSEIRCDSWHTPKPSVSSVSGVGAYTPVAADMRAVHVADGRTTSERGGWFVERVRKSARAGVREAGVYRAGRGAGKCRSFAALRTTAEGQVLRCAK